MSDHYNRKKWEEWRGRWKPLEGEGVSQETSTARAEREGGG